MIGHTWSSGDWPDGDVDSAGRAPLATVVRIGLLLTLAVLVIGSPNFAHYDWSGVPSNRASAQSSFGKCAGTQSTRTPIPA